MQISKNNSFLLICIRFVPCKVRHLTLAWSCRVVTRRVVSTVGNKSLIFMKRWKSARMVEILSYTEHANNSIIANQPKPFVSKEHDHVWEATVERNLYVKSVHLIFRAKGQQKEFFKRHHRWTEGLISAAKAVGWGAKVLVWVKKPFVVIWLLVRSKN